MGFWNNLLNSASTGLTGGLGSVPGALISGGLGQLFDSMSVKRDWKYQQKEMALEQEYNKENMAIQNQYAIDAWNRNNEYNDPRNVVSRFRAAGISPQAVFGSSTGGAGVSSSPSAVPDSSGPSGSGRGSRASFAPTMTLAESISARNSTKLANAQSAVDEARADNIREDTITKAWNNSMNELRALGERLNIEKSKADLVVARVEALWAPIRAAQDAESRSVAISKARQEIKNLEKEFDLKQADIDRLNAQTDLLIAQTETEDATRSGRVSELEADVGLKNQQAFTEWYKRDFLDKQAKLADVHSEEAKKRMDKMDKEIDVLVEKKELTVEQAKYLKNARARAWAEFGVNTAATISEELRGWLSIVKGMSSPPPIRVSRRHF